MENSDRLSSLPDDVLCHILSFLPTKLSVATSILATRYRFLWADVPNLDFDCDIHYESSFVDTISRVLSHRNVRDINTFRLKFLMIYLPQHNSIHGLELPLHAMSNPLIIVYDLEWCIISSPTIQWLKLNLDNDVGFWGYKLQINTPALRYLNVSELPEHFSTGTFNSLVEADICLYNDSVNDDVLYSSTVLELVDKVCQVKCLTLSVDYTQFLDSSFAVVTSKFINLTKLELDADWRFLFKFLESADNLQVLIIREVHDNLDRDNLKCWREPQQIPTCLSSHLRQVTIDAFGYSEDEFKLVRYILKNGEVLKMMKIYGRCSVPYLKRNEFQKKKFNAPQRISAFERRSQTCEVKFS